MDVCAVYKGKGKGKGKKDKSKGKGNDKVKDPETNPDAEMICNYCHRKVAASETAGHWRRQGQEGCERRGASAWIDARGRCGALGDAITSDHDRTRLLDEWSCGFSLSAQMCA